MWQDAMSKPFDVRRQKQDEHVLSSRFVIQTVAAPWSDCVPRREPRLASHDASLQHRPSASFTMLAMTQNVALPRALM